MSSFNRHIPSALAVAIGVLGAADRPGAAAVDKTFDADPSVWKFGGGKLYANVSADVARQSNADLPAFVRQASANRPADEDKAPSEIE